MFTDLKEQNQDFQKILNALLQKGRLIWPRAIEKEYAQHMRQKILQRVPMVGVTSIAFLLLFAILDQFMLPSDLSRITATARIFIVCPIIFLCCLWLYFKPPKWYLVPYGFAFLFGSISVVWVIWLAHSKSVLLPYEGLMITMMYGFVVMGLPLYLACLLNAVTLFFYVTTEPFYYLSFNTYVNNVMFLSAMYVAGFISAMTLSYSRRNQFLQQKLLNLSEEMAYLDLESKNRYIAVASHDLRQPMQAINMMADQLCHNSQDENLHKLKSSASALSNMFSQLLDASKLNLDLMEIHLEPVDINSLLEQAVNAFSIPYEKHNMVLDFQPDQDVHNPWVNGDYAGIQRIINNLLQNAMVHSGATEVVVKSTCEENRLILCIKDNGRGIALEQQKDAFEEFNQLDTPNKDQGLGVGLSIVAKLSKAMGYELELNSSQGCEFIITLPLIASPKNCEKNKVNLTDSEKKIIIIEDDEDLSSQYFTWFKNWHWKSEMANTLEHGERLIARKPNWVITDWNLPGGSGRRIVNQIVKLKNQDIDYQPKVLIISSHGNLAGELEEELAASSSFKYLLKPITASRLRAAIEDLAD